MLQDKAEAETAQGRLNVGNQSFREAEASANRYGMKGFAAFMKAEAAVRNASYGNCVVARRETSASLVEVPSGNSRRLVAGALALCGDSAAAQKLVTAEDKEHPESTLFHSVTMPVVKALASLQQGDAASAAATMEAGRPFELGTWPVNKAYWVLYVRGLAYLRAKDGAKAAAEFQKILDHRTIDALSEIVPLAQLNLARAYALQGDSLKARAAYQDFLALWKDADPDVPILLQAKGEYARLQ